MVTSSSMLSTSPEVCSTSCHASRREVIHGDDVSDIRCEPGRGNNKKTFLGALISYFVSGFVSLVNNVCKLLGIESPIERLQRTFLIAPNNHVGCTPCELNIPHEKVEIPSGDGVLRGHLLQAPLETKKTIIFLNGRGHNSSNAIRQLAELQKQVNVNILVVDYRGCGESSGTPTLNGLVDDAAAMYDYLKSKGFAENDISAYGVSLGGGVATALATRRPLNTLFVQSSFTSMDDIAGDIMSSILPDVLTDSLTPLAGSDLNSRSNMRNVKAKNVIILHGTADEVIPYNHGVSLFRAAKDAGLNVMFKKIKGAGHTNFSNFYDSEGIHEIFRRILSIEDVNKKVSYINTSRRLSLAA